MEGTGLDGWCEMLRRSGGVQAWKGAEGERGVQGTGERWEGGQRRGEIRQRDTSCCESKDVEQCVLICLAVNVLMPRYGRCEYNTMGCLDGVFL